MLKTVFWANSLMELAECNGPGDLAWLFGPRDPSGDISPVEVSLWRELLAGRRDPLRALAAIEAAIPGANTCLRSPLWRAIAGRELCRLQIFELVRALQPPIQALVVSQGLRAGPNSGRLADKLERNTCLDALAAEVLLLRLAHVEGRQEAAYQWGRYVWRMMVLLGPAFVDGGIARAMAELMDERIRPMATLHGASFGFPPGSYVRVVPHFLMAVYQAAKPSPESKTDQQLVNIARRLFSLTSGFDYFSAFNPLRLIDEQRLPGEDAEAERQEVCAAAEELHLHLWGLNMQRLGGHPKPPPDAACSGAHLWAIDPTESSVLLDPAHFRARETFGED